MQQPRGTKILPHHHCIVPGMAYSHFKFLWSQLINISSLITWAAMVVWQKFTNVLEEYMPSSFRAEELFFYTEDEDSMFLQNISKFIPGYTAQHSRKRKSTQSTPRKPQILISVLLTNHLSLIIRKANYHERIERSLPSLVTFLFKLLLVRSTQKTV
jgi:hypothetical protein